MLCNCFIFFHYVQSCSDLRIRILAISIKKMKTERCFIFACTQGAVHNVENCSRADFFPVSHFYDWTMIAEASMKELKSVSSMKFL